MKPEINQSKQKHKSQISIKKKNHCSGEVRQREDQYDTINSELHCI